LGIVPVGTLYYKGRFSNGPVWVEHLVEQLRLNGTLYDNAYGGATTDGVIPPGLINQVNDFLTTPSLPPDSLYIIWSGANDFLINNSKDYEGCAKNVNNALEALAQAGANNILIMNLPNLGATPKMNTSIDTYDDYRERTILFNDALEKFIEEFKKNYPAIELYFFDIFSFLEKAIKNPEVYGFTNVTESCPSFFIINNFENNEAYLFWDDIHPTTEAHRLLARIVAEKLGMSIRDGDIAPLGNRDREINIGDALIAMRFALGLEAPLQEDIDHGDVAPLGTFNVPNPDGNITVGDALIILRKALGIIYF
jgi:lysophospholipase L1-like esterase